MRKEVARKRLTGFVTAGARAYLRMASLVSSGSAGNKSVGSLPLQERWIVRWSSVPEPSPGILRLSRSGQPVVHVRDCGDCRYSSLYPLTLLGLCILPVQLGKTFTVGYGIRRTDGKLYVEALLDSVRLF